MNVKIDFFERIRAIEPGTVPLYMQLQHSIRGAIERGELKSRDILPPEREISSRLEISRITVRKAISGLVEDGLLTRQQGSGTFVAARIEKQFGLLSSFSEDMAMRGHKVTSTWLGREKVNISPDEALAFGLGLGAKVFRFRRVRCADGITMAVESATIAGFALPSEAAVQTSLYEALAKHANRPVRALQRLRAVLFDAEQARLLNVDPGSPALLIERRGFNSKGLLVELTKSWYRGDSYDFVSEVSGI